MNEKMANSWWVYMLLTKQNKIYTGITVDIDKRFKEHEEGRYGAKCLKGKGPLQLLFKKKVGDRSKASRIEWHIKQLKRPEKEALITGSLRWQSFIYTISRKS